MGFFDRELAAKEVGLDLDALQDRLERIAKALERIAERLDSGRHG